MHTASLHQAMRFTTFTSPIKRDALLYVWLISNSCDWHVSILAVSLSFSDFFPFAIHCCSCLDRGHQCLKNFYLIIPVDVVRVKYSRTASLTLHVYQ